MDTEFETEGPTDDEMGEQQNDAASPQEPETDVFGANQPFDATTFGQLPPEADMASFFQTPTQAGPPPTTDFNDFTTSGPSSDTDIFDLFTNLNNFSSDPVQGEDEGPHGTNVTGVDPIIQNGLTDFDMSQFWETFKPLVEDQAVGGVTQPPSGQGQDFGSVDGFDHAKLAEEMHALFSGCLM
jgi:hypothetical protein